MVFVLSNQSFPACFPAGGEGNCLKIIRLEDGSLSDLTAVFLDTVANYAIPAGSVVLIHSLSYLTWVGPAAYAEDFVRARQPADLWPLQVRPICPAWTPSPT